MLISNDIKIKKPIYKKHHCLCGSMISPSYFNSHLKTDKHKKLLKDLETTIKKNDSKSLELKF